MKKAQPKPTLSKKQQKAAMIGFDLAANTYLSSNPKLFCEVVGLTIAEVRQLRKAVAAIKSN